CKPRLPQHRHPGEPVLPAFFLGARANRGVEDVLDELRRIFDFGECMHLATEPANAGNQLRAIRAAGGVRCKRRGIGGWKFAVEIFAQPLVRNFALPVHFIHSECLRPKPCLPYDGRTPISSSTRASSMRPRLILDFTVPSGTSSTD